jgi:hypothetical protein
MNPRKRAEKKIARMNEWCEKNNHPIANWTPGSRCKCGKRLIPRQTDTITSARG